MIMDEIKFGRMLNKKVRDTLMSKDTKQTAQKQSQSWRHSSAGSACKSFHDNFPKHRHCLLAGDFCDDLSTSKKTMAAKAE
jgi:hypothetical protein